MMVFLIALFLIFQAFSFYAYKKYIFHTYNCNFYKALAKTAENFTSNYAADILIDIERNYVGHSIFDKKAKA
jgi:hypothetical protein